MSIKLESHINRSQLNAVSINGETNPLSFDGFLIFLNAVFHAKS